MMKSEKEQLVDFALFMANKTIMSKHLPENAKEQWMKYPLSGVRMAVNDMLEAGAELNPDHIKEIDAELRKRNIPTLSNLLHHEFMKFLSIESRNRIKNETEWRLVRSLVETDILDTNQKDNAYRLMGAYEDGI